MCLSLSLQWIPISISDVQRTIYQGKDQTRAVDLLYLIVYIKNVSKSANFNVQDVVSLGTSQVRGTNTPVSLGQPR